MIVGVLLKFHPVQWQVEPIAIPAQEEAGHVPSWTEVGGATFLLFGDRIFIKNTAHLYPVVVPFIPSPMRTDHGKSTCNTWGLRRVLNWHHC